MQEFLKMKEKSYKKTLEVDAGATVAGTLLGVSTTTSFIESASGVEEGGRTGLTAVATGLFFCTYAFYDAIFLKRFHQMQYIQF